MSQSMDDIETKGKIEQLLPMSTKMKRLIDDTKSVCETNTEFVEKGKQTIIGVFSHLREYLNKLEKDTLENVCFVCLS